MNKFIIYALVDPITKAIRYIGKSVSGANRYKEHLKLSALKKEAHTHKARWILKLLSHDLKPEFSILHEAATKEELGELEKYYISLHKSLGADLTNLTNGGDGNVGWTPSEQTREKISEAHKKHWEKIRASGVAVVSNTRIPHTFVEGHPYKKCSDCDQLLPLTQFSIARNLWDGLKSICKSCSSVRDVTYRTTHRDKYKQSEAKTVAARAEVRLKCISILGSLCTHCKTDLTSGERKVTFSHKQTHSSVRLVAAKLSTIVDELQQCDLYCQSCHNALFKNTVERLSKAKSKPVVARGIITRDVLHFSSALEAKERGFHNVSIGKAIKTGKPYKGYLWSFK
jgi:hypothetical protein